MTSTRVLVIAMAGLLVSCASASIDPQNVARDPDRAVIVGWGRTGLEILQNTVALPLGVRVGGLYVQEANGSKTDGNVTKLMTGTHDLAIACHLYIGGSYQLQKPFHLRAEVKSGRVYALRPRPQAVSCAPYLEDITDTLGKSAP